MSEVEIYSFFPFSKFGSLKITASIFFPPQNMSMAWKTACPTSRMPEALKLLIQWQVGGVGGEGRGGGGATGHVIQPSSSAPRISFPHCSTCQHALTGGLWEIGELGNTMKKERLDPTSEINQSINQSINSILILIPALLRK